VRLTIRTADGTASAFPLRKGIEIVEREAASEVRRSADDSEAAGPTNAPTVVYRSTTDDGRPFLLYYVRLPLGRPLPIARLTFDLVDGGGRFWVHGLGFVSPNGAVVPVSSFEREEFRPVHRTDRAVVFENEGVLDRVYAAHKVRLARDGDDALAILRAIGAPRSRLVILEDPSAPEPSGRRPSQVVIVRDDPTRVELEATMGGDGYVVLSDAHYPAWRAFVDGAPAPVYRANYAFRAVYAGAGSHRVVFVFEPFWLRRRFAARLERDPQGALRRMTRHHWVVLVLSLCVVAAAVAGSHGLI
jgi:hypothetical protein